MITCKIPSEHLPVQTGCEKCTKEWKQQYYKDNKEAYKTRQRKTDSNRRERNRALIREAKNVPCADCNLQYPWYVMDFDHISGDKEKAVSHMLSEATKKVQKEIDKCEVVCSNCHRERTYQRSSVV